MERKKGSGLKHLCAKCLGVFIVILTIGFGAMAQDDSPSPILLTESNSTRALAVSSNQFRGFLPRKSTEVFFPGAKSRVVLFASNLALMPDETANAFRFYLEDADGKKFRLQVLSIRPVKGRSDVSAITVKLYDANAYNGQPEANGDVFANLTWRGMTSNVVKLGLGSTGGKLDSKLPDASISSDSPKSAEFQTSSDLISEESSKSENETSFSSLDAPTASRVRFMEQATFGPNAATDLRLRQIGHRRWIDEQFEKPYPSTPYPNLPLQVTNVPMTCDNICRRDFYSMYQLQNWFYKDALYGDAQLRRRVSWALAQMWVVSGTDTQQARWELEYIKILDKHAFGNYRDLMRDMTLNPAMGNYLDMVRSTRQNPNENYPREILQLFAVGLNEMNLDGTPKLDSTGSQIPTYDQNGVNQFTKIFTGWTLAPPQTPGIPNYIDPMVLVQNNHDTTAKTLFNYPGAPFSNIPAGQNGSVDLSNALDNIFNHPN
ncbi:MAG: DUF1800 family protein, partial [Pyrinomonadaceae bacterium]|nr:DUF1800 family protein [Pyrinomonadaceae bacterium]